MRLFDKLVKLLYPTYIDMAIGNKSPNEIVENNLDKHNNVLLKDYLIPTIRWCDVKKDYISSYKIPKKFDR